MKYCFLIVLAACALSVTDAFAAGNAEDLQKKFSSHFSMFYDFTQERRGMLPMTLLDDKGQKTSFDDYKGRVTIVHFWATWCPPCITELPKLKAYRDSMQGRDINIILVSLDFGATPEKIEKFMKKQGISNLPVLRVPSDDPAWDKLTSFGLPGTFIVDAKGRVLFKFIGDNDWTGSDSVAFIDSLLTNQKK